MFLLLVIIRSEVYLTFSQFAILNIYTFYKFMILLHVKYLKDFFMSFFGSVTEDGTGFPKIVDLNQ